MAKSLYVFGLGNVAAGVAGSGTQRYTVANCSTLFSISSLTYTRKMRTAGTYSLPIVKIVSNTRTATCTYFFRNVSGALNQTISVSTTATGIFEDSSNTDVVATGDELSWALTVGGTGAINYLYLSGLFSISGTTYTNLYSTLCSYNLNATTRYHPINSIGNTAETTEANAAYRFKAVSTVRNLQLVVYANARTTNITVNSRKNSAAGNMSVVIPAGVTGLIEDTTNTDSLAVNDTFNYEIICGASAEACSFILSVDIDCATQGILTGNLTTNYTMASGTSRYFPPMLCGATTWTESDAQLRIQMDCDVINPRFYISSNSSNYSTTFKLRKNGADTGVSIIVGASTTGWFENTSSTVSVSKGDLLNWEAVAGTGTGSLTIKMAGVDYKDSSLPPSSTQKDNLLLLNIS